MGVTVICSKLVIKLSDGGGAKITSIAWEQNKCEIRVGEEGGKKEAVIVCRMVLRCDFDTLPLYGRKILWALWRIFRAHGRVGAQLAGGDGEP